MKQHIPSALLLLALANSVLAQQTSEQTFDDTDPIIVYSGNWVHATDGNGPTNNTQSYSNIANASYSFTFAGTGFSICAGKKDDRGTFSVTIDGVLAGTGSQTSTSTDAAPACETVFDVNNLAATGHTVVVTNTGSGSSPYLTVDSITLDVLNSAVVASSSSLASSSSAARSSSSSVSKARASSASSVSLASAQASGGAVNTGSGTSTGAIAGGVVGGIIGLALLAGLLWFCCFRKRRRNAKEEDFAINPFVSEHDTEENNDYRPSMSQNSGPPVIFTANDSPRQAQHSSNYYAGQPALPPALPMVSENQALPSADRYSNQYLASENRRDPAPSRRTSYASAFSQQPVQTPEVVPQIPMSFSGGRDQPSPFALPAFPVDVEDHSPVEDAYGGMVDGSENDEHQNGHARRASEVDLVVTRNGSKQTKRKPVPQA